MYDSRGVRIVSRDIIARRMESGWRISRASIVGFMDRSRTEPVLMCVDFDSHHSSNAWNQYNEGSDLLHIANIGDKPESTDALMQRVPELNRLFQEQDLDSLRQRIQNR